MEKRVPLPAIVHRRKHPPPYGVGIYPIIKYKNGVLRAAARNGKRLPEELTDRF